MQMSRTEGAHFGMLANAHFCVGADATLKAPQTGASGQRSSISGVTRGALLSRNPRDSHLALAPDHSYTGSLTKASRRPWALESGLPREAGTILESASRCFWRIPW